MKHESQRPIIIGFDMDGVVIDHTALRILVGRQFGFDLTPEETPSDVIRNIIPDEIRKQVQNEMYNNKAFALQAVPMMGALTGLQMLREAGIPFFLISRRKDPILAMELLKKHNLWPQHFDESNTFFVEKPEHKNERAVVLGVTHYIDDEEGILDVLTHVPEKLLFDQYNNRDDAKYQRVCNWDDLIRFFRLK